ncbi:hypothetical protein ACYF6T_01595 [Streptomyces sp. 7R007]
MAEPAEGAAETAPLFGGAETSRSVGAGAPMPEAYPRTTITAATSVPATISSRWSPGQDALAKKDMAPPDAVRERQ